MDNNIKAIILDVDGIIIGDQKGLNSPDPTLAVMKAISKLKQNGYKVSFCTGKPYLAIKQIIDEANLYDFHITDGGGVLMDPLTETMLVKNTVNSKNAKLVIEEFIANNVYMEFYSSTDYFIQKSQLSMITDQHTFVLRCPPKMVGSLKDESSQHEITKLMLIANNAEEIPNSQAIFDKNFKNKLNLRWGLHPVINPLQFGVITAKGISKGQMVLDLIKRYGISTENVLAIGDSTSDWDFMQYSGYIATLDNGSDALKELISRKGRKSGYIGRHVNLDGFIDILKHFNLI